MNLLHVLTGIDLGTLFVANITVDNRLSEVGVLGMSVAQDWAIPIFVTLYLIILLINGSRSILIKWNGALIGYER